MGKKEENGDLEKLDRLYLWHPFTQMKDWLSEKPVIISEAKDCFLKDLDGKWYLDGVSSLWVNIHGHRKAELDEAVRSQLDLVAHTTMLGMGNVPAIKLAEKLVGLLNASFKGNKLTKVFYSDNGSTAVEVALKMAFQYWRLKGVEGRNRFIALDNAYHGDTLGAVSVGGIDMFHDAFRPLLFKTHRAPSPYCYRCTLTDSGPSDCGMPCLEAMEETIKAVKDETAAVIVEPLVQAAGGMIVFPPGYLKGLRELCNKYGLLLIADEVATGFGRTGKMFACEHESVMPDIICLSKGLTGGYMPLAATVCTGEIFNAFLGEYAEQKTFFHGHSYTGNPLACACALACIEVFEKENTIEALKPKIKLLEWWLGTLRSLPMVGDARNAGLMAGVELVKDKETREPFAFEEKAGWRVAYQARKTGVIIRPLGGVVVVMPPLSISIENLKQMFSVLEDAIGSISAEAKVSATKAALSDRIEIKTASTLHTGINENIEHGGKTYHVQTEDLGGEPGRIRTLVYSEGKILFSKTTPYEDIKAEGQIPVKVKFHHHAIIKGIRTGKLKDKIKD